MDLFAWFKRKPVVNQQQDSKKEKLDNTIPPGRVSVPDNQPFHNLISMMGVKDLVLPSFRADIIPIIRDLYKVNPDVSIALQDMFKLANTGHTISFPNNTSSESEKMKAHLKKASKNWTKYTAGIDGLVNKFMVQCLIGGAISIEAVP